VLIPILSAATLSLRSGGKNLRLPGSSALRIERLTMK